VQLRATSTETRNGATASVTQPITVKVLSGTAATTPVGVDPYVTLVAAASANASTAGAATPTQIVVSTPIVSASGMLQFTAAPIVAGRTWDEEEAADRLRARGLEDTWLKELEQEWLALGYVDIWFTPGIEVNLPVAWPEGAKSRFSNKSISFNTQKLQQRAGVQVSDRYFNDFNVNLVIRVASTSEMVEKLEELSELIASGILPVMSSLETLQSLDECLNKSDAPSPPDLQALVTRFTPITIAYMARNPALQEIARRILSDGVYQTTKEVKAELMEAVGLPGLQYAVSGGNL
jgi:hypothetical protein